MKYTFSLLVGILIFIPFTKVDAQVFATGQANTSYIYPIIDENGPERLFSGPFLTSHGGSDLIFFNDTICLFSIIH